MTKAPAPGRLLADTVWLRHLARRLVGDDLAEDLQQDVAVAALARPQQAAAGRSWLAAVARNLGVSLRRRRSAEQRRVGALPPREPAPSPAELAAAAELQQKAVAALLTLPLAYRDTLLLRFMQGLSLAETASAMGVPEETVRTRQKRALALLREQLAPRERCGRTSVLATLSAWSVAVKAKHLIVCVAIAMIALPLTVLLVPSTDGQPTPGAPGGIAAAAAGPRPDQGAEAGAAIAVQRTAVATEPRVVGRPAAELTVDVRWPGGAPAADHPIMSWSQRPANTLRSGTTDAGGRCVFADLPPGTFFVVTMQYDNRLVELHAGGREHVSITLQAGFGVRGSVVDRIGTPVAGAEIWIGHAGVAPNWTLPAGHSDHSGRFAITGCLPTMLIGATEPRLGVSGCAMLLRERHGGATPEEVVLQLDDRVAEVHGRVVDGDGRPLAAACVELGDMTAQLKPDAKGQLWSRPTAALCTTDADGRFSVRQAPVDCGRLVITHRGYAPHREELALAAHVVREVAIVLRPGAVLTGTVLDATGQPAAEVDVEGPFCHGLDYETKTDAGGVFTLRDLAPGPSKVAFRAKGWPTEVRTFVLVAGERQNATVELARGLRIRGRLVDGTGKALVGWWLQLPGANRAEKTDDAGRFVVPGCQTAGNLLIVRQDSGFTPEILRFRDLAPGEDEREFVVPAIAMPSARLLGQCVGPDGAPLADVGIDCAQDKWPVLLKSEAMRAAADGRIDLGPFPPGRYVVTPTHARFVFAPVAVELQPNEPRDLGVLRGSAPALLTVKLIGDPTTAARMHVGLVGGGTRRDSEIGGSERTFARVLPGKYRLVVRGDDERDQDRDGGEVELAPGSEVVRELAVR
jgi:RNA polymerase sigma-70 factor (ECF subfamily)